jgi:hypothetical protein
MIAKCREKMRLDDKLLNLESFHLENCWRIVFMLTT